MMVISGTLFWVAAVGLLLSLLFAIVLAGYFFARVISYIFNLPLGFTPQLRKELKVVAAWSVLVLVTILLGLGSFLTDVWLGIDIR